MPHERFFIDHPLKLQETVSLIDMEFRHLCHVMRMRVGENVELVNGKNQLAQASILALFKDHADLNVTSVFQAEEKKPKLILAQGIPRFNRLESILEKGTELNVSEFWLFPGAFSEKAEFSKNQIARMELITINAMKQCGRLDLPTIVLTPPLLKWDPPFGLSFFGDTAPDAPAIWDKRPIAPAAEPLILFIGPESGFSEDETLHLQNKLHAQGVRLHQNILRTDTASITGLSVLQMFV